MKTLAHRTLLIVSISLSLFLLGCNNHKPMHAMDDGMKTMQPEPPAMEGMKGKPMGMDKSTKEHTM